MKSVVSQKTEKREDDLKAIHQQLYLAGSAQVSQERIDDDWNLSYTDSRQIVSYLRQVFADCRCEHIFDDGNCRIIKENTANSQPKSLLTV